MIIKNLNKLFSRQPNNLSEQATKWEAIVGMFPRPINEQHLSSYAAFRRLSANLGKSAALLFGLLIAFSFGVLLIYFGYNALFLFDFVPEIELSFDSITENAAWILAPVFILVIPFLALLVDNYRIWNSFLGFSQIESHGTSRWAFLSELRVKNLLWQWHPTELSAAKSVLGAKTSDSKDLSGFQRILYKSVKPFFLLGLPDNPLENGYLPVASFGFGRWICLPLSLVARHMCFLGPPGSGKSASFFIMQARAFSKLGSAVILDLKGEIYRHSAFYYRRAFRMDFQRPETSDRFLLGSLCYDDPLAAGEIADLIVGYDPNTQTGGNPFWEESASMLLRCLLLLLAQKDTNFTPADIFEFIANHQFDEESKTDRLAEAMMDSGNEDIRNAFAPFAQLDSRTKSNILISMAAKLKPFQDPNVQRVLSAPTAEEAAKGCRIIDPALLRTKGTALFVVVPEGRASQLSNVLGTFFGSVANVLRRTGDTEDFKAFVDLHARRVSRSNALNWTPGEATERYIEENDLAETIENPAFVMLQFDEAGNVPLRNLSEDIGVGRGRKMCYVLGYQNFDQPEKQYGASVAGSILQSIGTKWALTGLTSKTSKYIVELLGKTTTYEYSSSDAEDDRFDRSSRRESMRDLMSDDELRTMPAYTQAVMISTDIRPLRVGFPPLAKEVDSYEESAPVYFNPNELTAEIADGYNRDTNGIFTDIVEENNPRRLENEVENEVENKSEIDSRNEHYNPFKSEIGTTKRAENQTVNGAENGSHQTANQAQLPFENGSYQTQNPAESPDELPTENGSEKEVAPAEKPGVPQYIHSKSTPPESENGSQSEADDANIENVFDTPQTLESAVAINGSDRQSASKTDGFFNSIE